MAAEAMCRGWVRVSKRCPCPVCGKPDYCTLSADKQLCHCMRIQSAKPSKCRLGGWLHALDDAPEFVLPLPPKEEKRPKIDWHAKALEMFKHSRAAQVRESLAETLGVSAVVLKRLGVGYGCDRRGEFSAWPERNPRGEVAGIVRRYNDGTKKCVRYSRHGLYFAPDMRPSDVVLCPEGGSDTAALLTIGLCAVGRPSNTGGVSMLAAKLKELRPKRVIVLGERDEKPEKRGTVETCPVDCAGCMWCYPGLAGARQTAERLRESLRCEVVARMPAAKDVREWIKVGHAAEFWGSLERC